MLPGEETLPGGRILPGDGSVPGDDTHPVMESYPVEGRRDPAQDLTRGSYCPVMASGGWMYYPGMNILFVWDLARRCGLAR